MSTTFTYIIVPGIRNIPYLAYKNNRTGFTTYSRPLSKILEIDSFGNISQFTKNLINNRLPQNFSIDSNVLQRIKNTISQNAMNTIQQNVTSINNASGMSVYELRAVFKPYYRTNTYMTFNITGNIDRSFNLPQNAPNSINKWFTIQTSNKRYNAFFDDDLKDKLFENSDLSIAQAYGSQFKIKIYYGNELTRLTNYSRQIFREGITNCMITPIFKYISDKALHGKCHKTRSKYTDKLLLKYEMLTEFANGVPEDKIDYICNKLNIDINVCIPFNDEPYIKGRCMSNRLTTFNFMNCKMNHVETFNQLFISKANKKNGHGVYKSYDEMTELYFMLQNENEYFVYTRNNIGINCIQTNENIYYAIDKYNDFINQFEKEFEMNIYKFDIIKNKELAKFISAGLHMNGTIDFTNIDDYVNMQYPSNICHIDMKSAYINYKQNQYYSGFLGKITDFRQCNDIEFMKNNIGYYRITNIVINNETLKNYNDKINIYINGNVYGTPELKFLLDNNVNFDLLEGCWGFGYDISMNDTQWNDKTNDGVKYYCKYIGCQMIMNNTRVFKMKCTEDFANECKQYFNGKVFYNTQLGEADFIYEMESAYSNSHFAGFIVMYQRIYVLQQLMKMNIDNIIRVCVDGIYYKYHDIEIMPLFQDKYFDIKLSNGCAESYINNLVDTYEITNNTFRQHINKELHLGPGGTGKTHVNLIDNGFVNMAYISPSHELGVDKRTEYKINYITHAKLLNQNESIDIIKYNNVLLIDEISMLTQDDKKTIFKLYDGKVKLLFAGDIGYQIEPIKGREMNSKGFDNVINYDYVHRFKCDKLRKLALKIRYHIKKSNNNETFIKMLKHNIPNKINKDNIVSLYKKEDIILVSVNQYADEYTEMLNHIEKYRVTETNRKYCNGQILFEKPEDTKCILKHGFTLHSVQGKTFKDKIFIDIRRLWSSRMIYTAISRAQSIEQIYLIC